MTDLVVNSIESHLGDSDIQLEQDDLKVATMKKNVCLFYEEDVQMTPPVITPSASSSLESR